MLSISVLGLILISLLFLIGIGGLAIILLSLSKKRDRK